MNQPLRQINPADFPHISLQEKSLRYDGPRYVPVPGQAYLGDTNDGRYVFPRTQKEQIQFGCSDRRDEIRDEISIVDGD